MRYNNQPLEGDGYACFRGVVSFLGLGEGVWSSFGRGRRRSVSGIILLLLPCGHETSILPSHHLLINAAEILRSARRWVGVVVSVKERGKSVVWTARTTIRGEGGGTVMVRGRGKRSGITAI